LRRHVPGDFGGPFQDGSLVVAMQDLSLLSLYLSSRTPLCIVFFFLSSPTHRFSSQLGPPAGRAASYFRFYTGDAPRVFRTRRSSRSRNSGNSNEEGYFAQSSVSEDFHEIPVSDASSSSASPAGVVLSVLSVRLVASSESSPSPPSSSEGMLLYDCVSYEALYAPSCAAPRDYELPQRCNRSSREELDIETIPCANSRGSTLKDSMIGARFDSPPPFHLRRAFPAALRVNNISRRFANLIASSDRFFTSIRFDSSELRLELRIL